MDKLLTEQELHDTFERVIRNSVKDMVEAYNNRDKGYDWLPTINTLLEIAQSQKIVHANMVIGNNDIVVEDGELAEFPYKARFHEAIENELHKDRNNLRSEQRERNK